MNFENFTRVAVDVEAIQWFPYKTIAIDGFQSIEEDLLVQGNSGKQVKVITRAVIIKGDHQLDVFPTDWIVKHPNGGVVITKNDEFVNTFVKASDLDLLHKLGSADDLAKFGLRKPVVPDPSTYTHPTYPYPGRL